MYNIQFYKHMHETQYWQNISGTCTFDHPNFLSATTRSNAALDYLFVEVIENERLLGRIFVQLLPFKGKELKNYLSEESSCLVRAAIETVLDNIHWQMAVIGNLFVSGDDGQYWEKNVPMTTRWEILDDLSNLLKKKYKADVVLITELTQNSLIDYEKMTKSGFQIFEIEPELSLNIPKHWKHFDDYLNDMKSKYKVRTRKVLSDSQLLEVKSFSAQEILENNQLINTLYKNVTQKVGFKLAEVSPYYFYDLKECLNEHFQFNAYFLHGEMIGFITTIDSGNHLDVHLIGLNYDINKSVCLYQRILYDCIQSAIDKQKSKVNFGKTAGTIKTSVGAKTNQVFAMLKHHNKMSNLGIKPLFRFLKPEEVEMRNPFKEAI
jgi:hypothetical protein